MKQEKGGASHKRSRDESVKDDEVLAKNMKSTPEEKRGLAKWYNNRSVDKLAVQMLKYQSRNGWSHRDVLRKVHPKQSM